MNMQKRIGAVLREFRKDAKLKQSELGALIGLSGSSISRLEAGVKSPSLKTLSQVAQITGNSLSRTFLCAVDINDLTQNQTLLKIKKIQYKIDSLKESIDAEILKLCP